MALYPFEVQEIVCKSIYYADKAIRSELADGYIANENDYTSNFTGMIRRNINARNYKELNVVSKVLNGSYERKYGADACIILANETNLKYVFSKLSGQDIKLKSIAGIPYKKNLEDLTSSNKLKDNRQ